MTKFTRKFLVFFLALLCSFCLAFGLTACDDSEATVEPNTEQTGGGEENPSTGGEDENPSTGGGEENPSTGGGDEEDPSTGGGEEENPSTGGDEEDPSSGGSTIDIADLLANLTFSGIKLTISDAVIKIPNVYVGNTVASYRDITFEAGELDIVLNLNESGEYELLVYASGAIAITDDYTLTYAADLYGDGVNAYVVYTDTSLYVVDYTDDYTDTTGISLYSSGAETYTETSTYVIAISYDYLFSMLETQIMSNDELMAYITMATESLEGYITGDTTIDDSVLTLINALGNYSESAAAFIGNIANSLFVTTTTESGTTVTFDVSAIQTLIYNAYTLTTSAFVDEYLGEGTYTAISEYITSIGSQTVYAYVTGTANELGIDNETLYSLINYVVELITGEPYDIASVLSGSSASELLALMTMTVDDLLTQQLDITTANIVTVLTQFSDVTLFNAIINDETTAAAVYEAINSILTLIDEQFVLSVTIDADGAVELLIAMDEFPIDELIVSYTIKLSTAAVIPETASDVIADITKVYTELAEAVSGLLDESGKYTLEDESYLTVSGGAVIYTIGETSYTISIDSDCSGILVEITSGGNYYISILNYSELYNEEVELTIYSLEDEEGNTVYEIYASTYVTTYDANGNRTLYSGEDSDGYYYVYTYTYDENGNLLTENYTNSYGNSWSHTYEYDDYGYRSYEKYVSGEYYEIYTYERDENGKWLSESYENSYGSSWSYTYEYDDYGYLSCEKYEGGSYYYIYTYEHDENGKWLSESYENSYGESWSYTYEYDEEGYLISETYENSDGCSEETKYTRDENGNETYVIRTSKQTEEDGAYYIYTYEYYYEYTYGGSDWACITTKLVYSYEHSDGTSWSETSEFDENGNISTYIETYDNTVYSETETTKYTYDDNDNVLTINYSSETVRGEEVTTYSYSYVYTYYGDGSKWTETYSNSYGDSYTITYTYNDNGDMLTAETVYSDTVSDTITYTYDEDYNLISETNVYKETEEGSTYTYTQASVYVYDANGNSQYASCIEETKTVYTDGTTETEIDTYTSTFTYTYTEDGIFESGTYTNSDNDTGTFTFNELGWLTEESYYTSDEEFIYSYTYEYNIEWEEYYDNYIEYVVYVITTYSWPNSEGGINSAIYSSDYEYIDIYY